MTSMHGVILAGGISSRMGFPKALMPIGNSFFLLAIYEKMIGAAASPVHIVINTGLRSSLEAQLAKFPEANFVLNNQPAKGQIHSLKLGLQAASDAGAAGALVALVDQPHIQPATLSDIMARATAAPGKIIVPRFGDKHGHPIFLPKDKFGAFIGAAEGKTARDILHENPGWVDYIDSQDPGVLADIDSPEDLFKIAPSGMEDMD